LRRLATYGHWGEGIFLRNVGERVAKFAERIVGGGQTSVTVVFLSGAVVRAMAGFGITLNRIPPGSAA
jgi:hypothetical protein